MGPLLKCLDTILMTLSTRRYCRKFLMNTNITKTRNLSTTYPTTPIIISGRTQKSWWSLWKAQCSTGFTRLEWDWKNPWLYLWTFQDRAAKLVDKLANIGGTMGLLTGFSFISFAEILYFTIKILLEMMKDRKVEAQSPPAPGHSTPAIPERAEYATPRGQRRQWPLFPHLTSPLPSTEQWHSLKYWIWFLLVLVMKGTMKTIQSSIFSSLST